MDFWFQKKKPISALCAFSQIAALNELEQFSSFTKF